MKPATVKEAYQLLRIPPNLQEHQLRVAALIKIITSQWKDDAINPSAIVIVELFHDSANILKFDFSNTAMLGNEAKNAAYWQKVQQEVKAKYGSDIHQATLAMDKEIGLSQEVLHIIDGLDWDNTTTAIEQKDWSVALAIYGDMRIGPFGILSIKDRINNLHARRPMPDYDEVMAAAQNLESTLQSHINLDLSTITDADLNAQFSSLLETHL